MPIDAPPYTPSKDPKDPILWPDIRVPAASDIYRIDEIFAGREGTVWSANSIHRSYIRKFRAITKPQGGLFVSDPDTLDDTDIVYDQRLPRPYSSYFSNWRNPKGLPDGNPSITGLMYADINALAVETQVAREDGQGSDSWIITVRYSTDIGETAPDYRILYPGTQQNQGLLNPESPQFKPWLMLPVYEYGYQEATVAKQHDLTGNPFLNTAGFPFTPAPTVEVAYATLTMTRNEKEFTPDMVSEWAYAVNDAPFMGYPAGCVQVMPPTAKVMWHGRLKYYRVPWRFRFKPAETANIDGVPGEVVTWQPMFLNQGFYQKVDGKQIPINKNGHRVSGQPHLLAFDGTALPVAGTPTFIRFDTYPVKDFTALFTSTMVP